MLSIEARPFSEMSEKDCPDLILYPSAVFDLAHDDTWLDHPFSRMVISDIQRFDVTDQSTSTRRLLLEHGLHPEDLATGTKNLLCCKFLEEGYKCRMSMMGENCYKYLMDIADERDICGVVTTTIFFEDSDLKGRPVLFVNSGVTVTTSRQFTHEMIMLQGSGVWDYET